MPTVQRIEDSLPHHATTSWIGGALCWIAAFVALAVLGRPFVLDPGDPGFTPAIALPAILLVVGLVQWAKWLRSRSAARRFGATVFEMESPRLAPGAVLRGRVRTAHALAPAAGFHLRLACTETITIADSAGSTIGRREDRLRYEAQVAVVGVADSARDGIRIEFAIPPQPIRLASTSRGLGWTLEVRADVEGAPFEALFAVPAAD